MNFNIFSKPAGFKWFINYTHFWGSKLYLDKYVEVGIALVKLNKILDSFVDALNIGFTYTIGVDDDYDNYAVKVSYRF